MNHRNGCCESMPSSAWTQIAHDSPAAASLVTSRAGNKKAMGRPPPVRLSLPACDVTPSTPTRARRPLPLPRSRDAPSYPLLSTTALKSDLSHGGGASPHAPRRRASIALRILWKAQERALRSSSPWLPPFAIRSSAEDNSGKPGTQRVVASMAAKAQETGGRAFGCLRDEGCGGEIGTRVGLLQRRGRGRETRLLSVRR